MTVPPEHEAAAYQVMLPRAIPLDYLVVNQSSDILLVSLHGATDRKKYVLPRFEWMNTLLRTSYSSLFFSDPTLHLREDLQLAWYTGWPALDLNAVMAEVVRRVAAQLGSRKIIVFGSSGGGFAALQLATRLPGSTALPMNAQTQISKYTVNGSLGVQRRYIEVVTPSLADPNGVRLEDRTDDWSVPMGERLSALRRYNNPFSNYVYMLQNVNDIHHVVEHYLPFRRVVDSGPHRAQCLFASYDGPKEHNPPGRAVFEEHLERAVAWAPETLRVSSSPVPSDDGYDGSLV